MDRDIDNVMTDSNAPIGTKDPKKRRQSKGWGQRDNRIEEQAAKDTRQAAWPSWAKRGSRHP